MEHDTLGTLDMYSPYALEESCAPRCERGAVDVPRSDAEVVGRGASLTCVGEVRAHPIALAMGAGVSERLLFFGCLFWVVRGVGRFVFSLAYLVAGTDILLSDHDRFAVFIFELNGPYIDRFVTRFSHDDVIPAHA